MNQRETSHRDRVEMIHLKQDGYSLRTIAERKQCHRDTVRHWWRVFRDGGWDALQPRARRRPTRGALSSFDPLVRYVVLRLKCAHPHWGPDVIRLELTRRPSLRDKAVPSRSAIARYVQPYLARLRARKARVKQRPKSLRIQPCGPHEVWQIDVKGDARLGACGTFAPLMVVEAWTSAPLATTLLPASLRGVTMRDVQHVLRETFTQWGLPDYLQMDRGSIFVGSTRLEWPGTLRLWLVGPGIQPLINDPYRPTQNAQVERQNRTWNDHVAVGAAFPTPAAAQHATDQARQDRLAHLPSRNAVCAGQPPLVACPVLAQPRRSFDPAHETALFDHERVELYLADWIWLRTVDAVGYISLANHNISVGRVLQGQVVEVAYDLTLHQFVAYLSDDTHTPLAHFSLPVIAPSFIMWGDSGGGDITWTFPWGSPL